jgi:hypothetical protein
MPLSLHVGLRGVCFSPRETPDLVNLRRWASFSDGSGRTPFVGEFQALEPGKTAIARRRGSIPELKQTHVPRGRCNNPFDSC